MFLPEDSRDTHSSSTSFCDNETFPKAPNRQPFGPHWPDVDRSHAHGPPAALTPRGWGQTTGRAHSPRTHQCLTAEAPGAVTQEEGTWPRDRSEQRPHTFSQDRARVETGTPGSPGPGRSPQTVGSRGNTAHSVSSEDTSSEPIRALTGPLHGTPSRPRPIRAGTWAEPWYQLRGGNVRNLALFLSCSAVACHGVRCRSAAGNTCTCQSVALRPCTPGCAASRRSSALPGARMSEPAGGLTKSTLDTREGRACNRGRALRERCRRECAQATEPNADGTSGTAHAARVGRRHHSAHFCSGLLFV